MKHAMQMGESHVSLEDSVVRDHVMVSIDALNFDGVLQSILFHVRPEDVEALRDAVAIVARAAEYSRQAAALRRHAAGMDAEARRSGPGWLGGYFQDLADKARLAADAATAEAERAKADLDAMKPQAVTPTA